MGGDEKPSTLLVAVAFSRRQIVRWRGHGARRVMIVRSGQDEIGRRSWAGSCVKYLQHKAVIARSTLHVTFGQVGATVAGTNSQITNPLRIWRFNRGWAVGRAHADAVLASSVILAAHLFTQI